MSQDRHSTGKLIPIEMNLERVKQLCSNWEYELDTEEDWREALLENEEPYRLINGKWYRLFEFDESFDTYFEKVSVDARGTITFDATYYDGGCCWEEIVERHLKQLTDRL
jgi:hypothetical protein